MGRNIIGDSICVLRVKVETENGFDAQVAEKIGELQPQVKAGIFDENYPRSLVDYVVKNIGNILNVEISGPRSAIAIPLRVAKNFSPESGVAFSSKAGNGGCGRLIRDFLSEWEIIPALQTAENSDSHVEFKCVCPCRELSEVVIKKSFSKSFKHAFDIDEIENSVGVKFDTILVNRPRAGLAKAVEKIRKRENPLVSLIVHDFSKYQSPADYLAFLEKSDYVFITAEDSDKSVIRGMRKALGANSYEELGEKVVQYKLGEVGRRMFLLPPHRDAEQKFITFFQTGLMPVRVEVPDKIRLKLKTAWLNGACVALAAKDWDNAEMEAPFRLDGVLPAAQSDLETFANWAVNIAYFGYPDKYFKPERNLILR